ncbi:Uncharacterized protein dnm_010160 [Desulfonema magnum]|uniref:Uncharacterized protein n=1 Tax=Desulfonema magnum TaxID=45655 RepID=A0A975BGC7_9BACT|nr:Uncharacterized protein dnm_010160 [Desulfonema magnum]
MSGGRRFPKGQISRISGSHNPGTDRFHILVSNNFRTLRHPLNPL